MVQQHNLGAGRGFPSLLGHWVALGRYTLSEPQGAQPQSRMVSHDL